MRFRFALLVAFALVAGGAEAATCVAWWPEVRYRPFGYDHIVHIRNSCTVPVRCLVTTDVNPHPMRADVPAGSEIEVVTWVGSPSREFTPHVKCEIVSSR